MRNPEAKNPNQRKAMAAYYLAHREEKIRKQAEYRAKNPERVKESRAKYYQAHKRQVADARDRYRKENPEKLREQQRRYYANNLKRQRLKARHDCLLRRARKQGASGSHTPAEWLALCWASGWRCYYCGVGLNEGSAVHEHKVPLCRGGSNSIENIAVSCNPCNCRKQRMTDVEYLERRALDARSKQ